MLKLLKNILLAGSFLAVSTYVNATPITSLYSTGVDDSHVALGLGATETHYSILDGNPSSLIVITHSAYIPNDATSGWISGLVDGTVSETYVTTFDLSGFDLSSVSLDLYIAVDNTIRDVLINDISTGFTIPFGFPAFQSFHYLNINSNFIDGINTLKFEATNEGGPGGFRVNASGNGNTVPEPSVLALLGLGLVGIGFIRRRIKA